MGGPWRVANSTLGVSCGWIDLSVVTRLALYVRLQHSQRPEMTAMSREVRVQSSSWPVNCASTFIVSHGTLLFAIGPMDVYADVPVTLGPAYALDARLTV
jgi:hypothetical protein